MLFQHASELALRATLFLAKQAPGKLTPVHEMAAHAGVSEAYLAKILNWLPLCTAIFDLMEKTTLADLAHIVP